MICLLLLFVVTFVACDFDKVILSYTSDDRWTALSLLVGALSLQLFGGG